MPGIGKMRCLCLGHCHYPSLLVINPTILASPLKATIIKSAVRMITPSISKVFSKRPVNSSTDKFCHMTRAHRQSAPVLIPPTTAAVFLRNFNKEKIKSLACLQGRYR